MRDMRTVVLSSLLSLGSASLCLADEIRTGRAAYSDWHSDAPGVRRLITVHDLQLPKAGTHAEEPDTSNSANVVSRPSGVLPKVPAGFSVDLFASGLRQPRVVRVAPNGDVFVAESGSGRILSFAKGRSSPTVFADELRRPFGIAFYPVGTDPQFIYVGETQRIVRFPYVSGDLKARSAAQVIIPGLPTKGHWTRDVVAAGDGRLFYSIGASSNIASDMPKKSPEDIRAFEATHGVGAAWGDEENRAMVRVYRADGSGAKTFATGLRNCSGLAIEPRTNELWCAVNERDHLGDNVPPEFVTRVKENGFYGWPWYFIGDHEDPRLEGRRPDLRGHVEIPDVLLEAHTAPLSIAFYEGSQFPAEYKGSAFVALHGSWNRTSRNGYKVVRLPMKDGKPTGVEEDFMTGFVLDDSDVWGRPVGVAVTADGSLLVSEDGNGTIWRVSWRGQ